MKNVIKRVLSGLLAVTIVFCSALVGIDEWGFNETLGIETMAANANGLEFILNYDKKSYTLAGFYEYPQGKLVIPRKYNGLPVTDIGAYSFENCTSFSTVTIPDSVTSIEWNAFRNCTNLTSITIPDSVDYIGWLAFEGCTKLTSIVIPDSVTYLGSSAFKNCKKLKSITLPDSPISVGYLAFYNTAYYNNRKNWDESAFYIGKHLIRGRTSLKGDYKVKNGTITIADSAFLNRVNVTSVTIPDSVKNIESEAFKNCTAMKNVSFSDKLGYIEYEAFNNCKKLTEIKIPGNIEGIGAYAFSDCTSLKSIIIPDSVRGIDTLAFCNTAYYNNKKNWEDSVLYIGNHLIEAKESLKGAYKIKDGTIAIAGQAFRWCSKLTEITLPKSLKYIDGGAFYDCTKLEKIYWNAKSAEDFEYCVFRYAGEKDKGIKVVFGKSVERIPANAVRECEAITSITIPDSVKSIGYLAFYYTGYYNNRSNWDESALYIGNHLIRGRHSLNGTYKVKKGTITVADKAFRNCDKLTSVKFPTSVKNIGKNIYYECDKIK